MALVLYVLNEIIKYFNRFDKGFCGSKVVISYGVDNMFITLGFRNSSFSRSSQQPRLGINILSCTELIWAPGPYLLVVPSTFVLLLRAEHTMARRWLPRLGLEHNDN